MERHVGKEVTPREGLKQGCYLSPILCAAFMDAFTADEPHEECHGSLNWGAHELKCRWRAAGGVEAIDRKEERWRGVEDGRGGRGV